MDEFGHKKFDDIALILKSELETYCSKEGMKITLKYIDPSVFIIQIFFL